MEKLWNKEATYKLYSKTQKFWVKIHFDITSEGHEYATIYSSHLPAEVFHFPISSGPRMAYSKRDGHDDEKDWVFT